MPEVALNQSYWTIFFDWIDIWLGRSSGMFEYGRMEDPFINILKYLKYLFYVFENPFYIIVKFQQGEACNIEERFL